MEYASLKVLGRKKKYRLKNLIEIPKDLKDALYKCRIVYGTEIQSITFSLYKRKKITSIKLVEDETISYAHKYKRRHCINKHTQNLAKGEGSNLRKKKVYYEMPVIAILHCLTAKNGIRLLTPY